MEIVVKGRNVEVPEHFRARVQEKLARAERYDPKIIGVDVELSHEQNRRQLKTCQRVQLTLAGRGPVVRAEASADSFYAALEKAVVKLEARLRRSADRRHSKQHARSSIGGLPREDWPVPEASLAGAEPAGDHAGTVNGQPNGDRWQDDAFGDSVDGLPGRVVRIKNHPADPMTVDDALFQMELVGHDFYLFKDAENDLCSVVYRRKGFDYGLLRLGG